MNIKKLAVGTLKFLALILLGGASIILASNLILKINHQNNHKERKWLSFNQTCVFNKIETDKFDKKGRQIYKEIEPFELYIKGYRRAGINSTIITISDSKHKKEMAAKLDVSFTHEINAYDVTNNSLNSDIYSITVHPDYKRKNCYALYFYRDKAEGIKDVIYHGKLIEKKVKRPEIY